MSLFKYYCENCLFGFEENRPIGTDNPKMCPVCGIEYGDGFYQDYGQITFGEGLIPKTTAMQFSDMNKKRVGKEKLAEMEMENKKYSGIGKEYLISKVEEEKFKKQLKEGSL